jgi:hypothetical protein
MTEFSTVLVSIELSAEELLVLLLATHPGGVALLP